MANINSAVLIENEHFPFDRLKFEIDYKIVNEMSKDEREKLNEMSVDEKNATMTSLHSKLVSFLKFFSFGNCSLTLAFTHSLAR